MEQNIKKDVYDLIAELVSTSEELRAKEAEVIIPPSQPEEQSAETAQEAPAERAEPTIPQPTEEVKQGSSATIRIVDKGFVNLNRMVQEQKELIARLNEKIQDFESEVHKEGSIRQHQPVNLEVLKEEMQQFGTLHLNQFTMRIKTTEDLILTQLQLLNSRVRERESGEQSPWLQYLTIGLLFLVSILLSVLIYLNYQLLKEKQRIPDSVRFESRGKPLPSLDQMKFPTDELTRSDSLLKNNPELMQNEDTPEQGQNDATSATASNHGPETVTSIAPPQQQNLVQNPVKPEETKPSGMSPVSRNDTIKTRSDVTFEED